MDTSKMYMCSVGGTEDEQSISVAQERKLLAAMLERAVMDLMSGNSEDCKSALKWMRGKEGGSSEHFSYLFVVEHLDLGSSYMGKLENAMRIGERRLTQMYAAGKKEVTGQFVPQEFYMERRDGRRTRFLRLN